MDPKASVPEGCPPAPRLRRHSTVGGLQVPTVLPGVAADQGPREPCPLGLAHLLEQLPGLQVRLPSASSVQDTRKGAGDRPAEGVPGVRSAGSHPRTGAPVPVDSGCVTPPAWRHSLTWEPPELWALGSPREAPASGPGGWSAAPQDDGGGVGNSNLPLVTGALPWPGAIKEPTRVTEFKRKAPLSPVGVGVLSQKPEADAETRFCHLPGWCRVC